MKPLDYITDFYKIDGISVHNSLLVVSKLFQKNNWDEQSNNEAVELLRPLFIYLDRDRNTAIQQALAEERERVVYEIKGLMKLSKTEWTALDDLLSSLDKPLPDNQNQYE